ncbi:MAG: hypothetical protein LBD18_06620 [Treponema sp.]|nr:hypothetical protein [Treponema sp.]
MALQTPKFYLAGSIEPNVRRARKSGFLRFLDRKNPQFEQALRTAYTITGGVDRHCHRRKTVAPRRNQVPCALAKAPRHCWKNSPQSGQARDLYLCLWPFWSSWILDLT